MDTTCAHRVCDWQSFTPRLWHMADIGASQDCTSISPDKMSPRSLIVIQTSNLRQSSLFRLLAQLQCSRLKFDVNFQSESSIQTFRADLQLQQSSLYILTTTRSKLGTLVSSQRSQRRCVPKRPCTFCKSKSTKKVSNTGEAQNRRQKEMNRSIQGKKGGDPLDFPRWI